MIFHDLLMIPERRIALLGLTFMIPWVDQGEDDGVHKRGLALLVGRLVLG